QDKDVADFIKENHLSQDEINRSISKFYEFINERKHFLDGDSTYIAKGYQPVLIMNEGYADVSYLETEELVEIRKLESIKN
ncbi:primosomal protein DnaI, partial [Streptococcus pyogenes]